MRPKSALFYVEQIQEVAADFVNLIRIHLERGVDGVTYEGDLLPLLHRFSLESIAVITLDTRMGSLKVTVLPDLFAKS